MTHFHHKRCTPLADRLWAQVEKSDGCWIWTGPTAPMGWYGHLSYQGKHWAAHRLSWTIANGPIPDGVQVLHHCDNPPCVRPDHLFLGTIGDNIRDAAAKGRMHPGEANGLARLKDADIVPIRLAAAAGESYRALGRQYGVSDSTIRFACRGTTWRYIGGPLQGLR